MTRNARGFGQVTGEGVLVLSLPLRKAVDDQSAAAFVALYRAQRLAMVRLAAFLVGDLHVAEDVVAMHRLPRRQREVLILRYWAELSEADIADTLGISKGTVKSTASRAVQALDGALNRHGGQA